jgi:hypothetical protein
MSDYIPSNRGSYIPPPSTTNPSNPGSSPVTGRPAGPRANVRGSRELSDSVGLGGQNLFPDVIKVQTLLQRAGEPIAIDGQYSDLLVDAIKRYQVNWTNSPSGVILPGDKTWRNLDGCLCRMVPKFVQFSAHHAGAYSYKDPQQQWGTPATVQSVYTIALRCWTRAIREIGIGEISQQTAGRFGRHQEHHNGRMLDIRPIRKDWARTGVRYDSGDYNLELTTVMIDVIRAMPGLVCIIFNDRRIPNLSRDNSGIHDDHLHVEFAD